MMITPDFYKQFKHNLIALGLNSSQKIAVAVSGGPDSVALLQLLTLYKQTINIDFVVLTVNHNLRIDAAEEVKFVQNLCEDLGVECYALEWHHSGDKNSQHDARLARYELLTQQCLDLNIETLLTAHHMDDMIETYLMREEKKSGIFGLLPTKRNFCNNIQILRPLYNISKAELLEYLTKIEQSYCTDQSNISDKYERGRLRKNLQTSHSYPDLRKEIIHQQEVLEKKAQLIQQHIAEFLAKHVTFNKMGYATITNAKRLLEFESAFYILTHIITTIRGENSTPRGRSISNLLQQLRVCNAGATQLRTIFSLHGTKIQYLNNKIVISREFGKKKPINVDLRKQVVIWDERYVIKVPEEHIDQGYYITHLTRSDITILKAIYKQLPQAPLLLTLPVIKKGKKLVAIPHLNYYDARSETTNYTVQFKPQFVSNIVHFYCY